MQQVTHPEKDHARFEFQYNEDGRPKSASSNNRQCRESCRLYTPDKPEKEKAYD